MVCGSVPGTAGMTVPQTWWSWKSRCCLVLFPTPSLWRWWAITRILALTSKSVWGWRALFWMDCTCSSARRCWWIVLKRRRTEFSSTLTRSDGAAGSADLQIRSPWLRQSFLQQLLKDIPIIHTLNVIQEVPVQNLKPALVKIYDYYQPSETFFVAPSDATDEFRFKCNFWLFSAMT